MDRKALISMAKAYSTFSDIFFKGIAGFNKYAGYKFVCCDGDLHLCFTNNWTLPDFLVCASMEDRLRDLLSDNGIPESPMNEEVYRNIICRGNTEAEEGRVTGLAEALASECYAVKLPSGIYLQANGIKSSLPFLQGTVYYKKVHDLQVVLYPYSGEFKLHIAPLLKVDPEKGAVVDVQEKKETKKNTEHAGGLFF